MDDLALQRGWLRGFFDGEGHIQFLRKEDGHKQTICRLYAANTDQSLVSACRAALAACGIDYRVYVRKGRPPRKALATIYISRHDSILQFSRLVGFASEKKAETLRAVVAYIEQAKGPKYTKELLYDLYIEQKMSLPDIARHFGKHSKQQWYFSNLLRQYRIPMRTKSEAIKLALAKKKREPINA